MECNSEGTEAPKASLLIVGLGNPGYEYVNTRHNAGFMVVDALMQSAEFVEKAEWQPLEGELYRVLLKRCEGRLGQELLVLKPMTYMNSSGLAVAPVLEWAALTPSSLLVVSDDLDMQLGRLRLRAKGSSGGHNGLKSIAECLGTQDFARLRVGVGRPQPGDEGVIDYVLGSWASSEKALLERVLDEAVTRLRNCVERGIEGFSVTLEEVSLDKTMPDEGVPSGDGLESKETQN
ncbi:MAG: aminoacyl-tRNA hydrolase [Victivallales bacterium]|nr:aminoacyl-tRNA hydrolase [Victivallales bacterium]